MPQLILEYSANIEQDIDFKKLLYQLHQVMAETAGVNIGNCKSRAVKREDYCVGDGDELNAFVHVDVGLFPRDPEVKQAIGQQMLRVLENAYAPSIQNYNLQITVWVRDIQPEFYFKIP